MNEGGAKEKSREVGRNKTMEGPVCQTRQFGSDPKKSEKPLVGGNLVGNSSCSVSQGWEESKISGREASSFCTGMR